MQRLDKWFDNILVFLLGTFLILHYAGLLYPLDSQVLAMLAIIGTVPVIISAWSGVRKMELTIDLLASVALVASLLAHEWASAVFINLMLASARIFARYTENQARRAIQSLLKLRPETVRIKQDSGTAVMPVEQVKIGDVAIVEAGERVPVDGKIVKGVADIDQSSLTGESLPVSKQAGDQVLSSTLNVSGTIEISAEKVGADTTLTKIIQLVESSQESKPSVRTIAERFTTWYIIIAMAGAALLYFGTRDLDFVLSLLLVACADDIAVAIPLAFMAAIGAAAKQGIIIKGGEYLEGITKMKTLLLDKTGTLTAGKMSVKEVVAFDDIPEEQVLRWANMVECFSEHPAAKAITEYAANQKVYCKDPQNFDEIPGKGSFATEDGKEIVAGKMLFLKERNIQMTEHQLRDVEAAKNRGLNTTLIAYDGKLVGFIGLSDKLRPEVQPSIRALKLLGVSKLVMLTGDNEAVAKKISDELGITEFHANLLPEDKLKYIKAELNEKAKVGMVGDGVNDAASLAQADVGIAMGAIGSDAAIEVADIALMRDDFSRIPAAMRLGHFTMLVTKQNFWIWGVSNAIGFSLVLAHLIGPQGAAVFNFVTDFFPFFNSLRLFRLQKDKIF